MQCISHRNHYDFDSIENSISYKGYPESISEKTEKPNFRRYTYPQTIFFVQCSIENNLFLSNQAYFYNQWQKLWRKLLLG